MIKVISVVGARPNFMKAAPVKHAFDSLKNVTHLLLHTCLLYTSDAADERSSVDLGGRRIIKKKTKHTQTHTHTQHNTT